MVLVEEGTRKINLGEIGMRVEIWKRKKKDKFAQNRGIYILRSTEINCRPRSKAGTLDNSTVIKIRVCISFLL